LEDGGVSHVELLILGLALTIYSIVVPGRSVSTRLLPMKKYERSTLKYPTLLAIMKTGDT